jgi:hypothetical protein
MSWTLPFTTDWGIVALSIKPPAAEEGPAPTQRIITSGLTW